MMRSLWPVVSLWVVSRPSPALAAAAPALTLDRPAFRESLVPSWDEPDRSSRRLQAGSKTWVDVSLERDSRGEGGSYTLTTKTTSGSLFYPAIRTLTFTNDLRIPISFVYTLTVTDGQMDPSVTTWYSEYMVERIAGDFNDCDSYCEFGVVLPAESSGTLLRTEAYWGGTQHAVFANPYGDYRDSYDGTAMAPPLLGESLDVLVGWDEGWHAGYPSLDVACTEGDLVYPSRDGVVFFVRRTYSEPCELLETLEDPFSSDHCWDQDLLSNVVAVLHCDGTWATYAGLDGPDAIRVDVGSNVVARETALGPCGRTGHAPPNEPYTVHVHLQTEEATLHEVRYPFPDGFIEDDDAQFDCGACLDAFVETSYGCSCFNATTDKTWAVVESECDAANFDCGGAGQGRDTCHLTTDPADGAAPAARESGGSGSSKSGGSDGSDTGTIVGAVVAVVAALLILVLLGCLCARRRRRCLGEACLGDAKATKEVEVVNPSAGEEAHAVEVHEAQAVPVPLNGDNKYQKNYRGEPALLLGDRHQEEETKTTDRTTTTEKKKQASSPDAARRAEVQVRLRRHHQPRNLSQRHPRRRRRRRPPLTMPPPSNDKATPSPPSAEERVVPLAPEKKGRKTRRRTRSRDSSSLQGTLTIARHACSPAPSCYPAHC